MVTDLSEIKLSPEKEEEINSRLRKRYEEEAERLNKKIAQYRDFNKKVYSFLIDDLKGQYENEKNPLYVWEAYQIARNWGIPLSDWILTYLDDAAEELLDQPPGLKVSESLCKAFKIPIGRQGQGTIFSKYEKTRERYWFVYKILRLQKEKPNLSLEEVFVEVCHDLKKEGIIYSEHNMKKWYDRLKDKVTLVED